MNNYRGDTFWRTYKVKYENAPYTFVEGDKIKVAFILDGYKYLEKEISAEAGADSITVEWTSEEMKQLKYNNTYILEVQVTTENFVKTHQESVNIKKDFII